MTTREWVILAALIVQLFALAIVIWSYVVTRRARKQIDEINKRMSKYTQE